MKSSKNCVVTPPLLKVMNVVGAKPAPPTTSGGFVKLLMLAAALPEMASGMSPLGNPTVEISTLSTKVPALFSQKMQAVPAGQVPAGVTTAPALGAVKNTVPLISKTPCVIVLANEYWTKPTNSRAAADIVTRIGTCLPS